MSTVATLVSPLVQVTSGASTITPSGPTTVAVRRTVSPTTPKVTGEGATVTLPAHSGGSSDRGIESSHPESEGGTHRPVPPTRKLSSSRSAKDAGTSPDTLVTATLRIQQTVQSPQLRRQFARQPVDPQNQLAKQTQITQPPPGSNR